MKIFNKLIFWIFGIAFLVSCKDDMAPQLPEPVVETPEVGERPELKQLHVEDRYLVDADGQKVNLHGFAQTYSPFFNNNAWGNYDVDACLRYNQLMTDRVLAAGWEVNFIRQHMDPYWSSPGASTEAEAHMFYNEERFRKYLDIVFVPMAEFAISRGFYVVMRPPGVCPKEIKVGDKYQEYLVKIWDIVSEHPSLKNNPYVMFELANEPVDILNPEDGSKLDVNANKDAAFTQLSMYFQKIVDTIRENGCNNILWVPGLSYQAQYAGYVEHPIFDPVNNYGFAIHVYPGWYGSDGENEDGGEGNGEGYTGFQRGWDNQVGPVAKTHPIMVTEMDWAPKKYNASWGKATTGEAGGAGFGANFKLITDNEGNVSWLLFTGQEYMAEFVDEPGVEGEYTFLNDPEACPWPIYHWYQEYAGVSSGDYGNLVGIQISEIDENKSLTIYENIALYLVTKGVYESGKTRVLSGVVYTSSDENVFTIESSGKLTPVHEGTAKLTVTYTDKASGVTITEEISITVDNTPFPLIDKYFEPDISGSGIFSDGVFYPTQYGFGGWVYDDGKDLTEKNFIVAELGEKTTPDQTIFFRVFDSNDYNGQSATYYYETGNNKKIVVDLNKMYKSLSHEWNRYVYDNTKIDPAKVGIVGFWSTGNNDLSQAIEIKDIRWTDEWPLGAVQELTLDGISTNQTLENNVEKKYYRVFATYADGSKRDVTAEAEYEIISGNDLIDISTKGYLSTRSINGKAQFKITYNYTGSTTTDAVLDVTVQVGEQPADQPLSLDYFNPQIYGSGTFTSEGNGGVFRPAQYGFGGWKYSQMMDFSSKKYIVADLTGTDEQTIFFRVFGSNDYNSSDYANYTYEKSNNNILVVDLNKMYKIAGSASWNTFVHSNDKINPSNIGIVGFWSNGDNNLGKAIKINSIEWTDEWPLGAVTGLSLEGISTNTALDSNTENQFYRVIATYADGMKRDVTAEAEYEVISGGDLIDISTKGYLTTKSGNGKAQYKITYDYTGGSASAELTVNVQVGSQPADEPFNMDYFNPSINGSGTFEGNVFTSGGGNFAGWKYAEPMNLGQKKFVVIDLGTVNPSWEYLLFRVYDSADYWNSDYASYRWDNGFNSDNKMVVDVNKMYKQLTEPSVSWDKFVHSSTEKIDPASVYMAGLYVNGTGSIEIESVEWTDSWPFGTVTDLTLQNDTHKDVESLTLTNGTSKYYRVIATYSDGTKREVTAEADYSLAEGSGLLDASIKGYLTSSATGVAKLKVSYSYTGGTALEKEFTINIE